ncbi:hypothetical protein GGR51DRAFT_532548 [Nemania sp. FL0031]|nr:hypothetical protein GGR51DRAFT_532548 [Nemania sp. FL0031]
MVLYKQIDHEIPFLEPEGELIAQHGSHEARVLGSEYQISNIRELLGHKVDLNFIGKSPAVRLDKN